MLASLTTRQGQGASACHGGRDIPGWDAVRRLARHGWGLRQRLFQTAANGNWSNRSGATQSGCGGGANHGMGEFGALVVVFDKARTARFQARSNRVRSSGLSLGLLYLSPQREDDHRFIMKLTELSIH